ncbi:MAG: tRNA lysidine(34) synthetase TilS [Alphaproteobacteria bacterium]|nr:MAG: tRNA lysidine(34) synthetase TilS [Alphaproteobacteria bacterium]
MHPLIDAMITKMDTLVPSTHEEIRMCVGVSGGADSIFAVHMLHQWACTRKNKKITIIAATVNHNLRPEAADEAAFVANRMRSLDIPHYTLQWHAKTQAPSQGTARHGRYECLVNHCIEHKLGYLITGHHAQDNAETILMRLARQSHIRGLRGLDERRAIKGVILLRPLLSVWPAHVQDYLNDHNHTWITDPSNANKRYTRTHARTALTTPTSEIARLGFTPQGLIRWSEKITQTHRFFSDCVNQFLTEHSHQSPTRTILNREAFDALHPELQRHVLETLIWQISLTDHPPRWESIMNLQERLAKQVTTTLGGWIIRPRPTIIQITPEPSRHKSTG